MGARLYGRLGGWGSYAQVCKGFQWALSEAGVLEGTVAVDEDPDLDEESPPGASAEDAVFTGPPTGLPLMAHNCLHERRYGVLAPNSDRVPPVIMGQYEEYCTELLAPSQWAQEVLSRASKLPVTRVPHGLLPGFAPDYALRRQVADAQRQGQFRVVHLSSSSRERKGTVELIKAWNRLVAERVLDCDCELTLLLSSEASDALQERIFEENLELRHTRVKQRLDEGLGAGPEAMARFLSGFHLVCQPSRAEGFGMVPLEARACGVPVLATCCTGHGEHMPKRDVVHGCLTVNHGPEAPIDDMPGAMAPVIDLESLTEKLKVARKSWRSLHASALSEAQSVRRAWSWTKKLAPFIRRLEEK